MILFHGSDKIIERPMALFGRNKVDFGQGFYLTNLHEQAVKWAKVVAFKKSLEDRYDLPDFTELSIGMSHDWPVAIRHGATIVRIGTAIFGPRVY